MSLHPLSCMTILSQSHSTKSDFTTRGVVCSKSYYFLLFFLSSPPIIYKTNLCKPPICIRVDIVAPITPQLPNATQPKKKKNYIWYPNNALPHVFPTMSQPSCYPAEILHKKICDVTQGIYVNQKKHARSIKQTQIKKN